MKVPLTVVFRNMQKSAWLEGLVRERAAKLDEFCDQIIRCRVVIDIPHKHHHQGNFYAIGLHIAVPGKEIVVDREAPANTSNEDVMAVLRDAFDAAKRQLREYSRRARGDVKTHNPPVEVPIAEIFEGESESEFLVEQTP